MPIAIHLDVVMARRKVRSNELAATIGITPSNLSLLKSGHVQGVRFSTLEAICKALDCQPGDLLEYVPDGPANVNEPEEEPAQPKKESRR